MRISLDLDGVLCDLSCATLTMAHVLYRAHLLSGEDLRCVYLRALPKSHPSRFVTLDDEVVIITGRLPIAHEWTCEWLRANGMGDYSLECVGDDDVECVWSSGDPESACVMTATRKAEACRRRFVDLHIDNNPAVVRYMRESGINAVCVRL